MLSIEFIMESDIVHVHRFISQVALANENQRYLLQKFNYWFTV